mmetsp:Transcript_14126/g.28159  ORF Transcript_14126/g.28159 Transcript_14126/m.28159 type:complete len:140 (-) Transcript_14126:135-554(-)
MDVVQPREFRQDIRQPLTDGLLREFYLTDVETADPRNLVPGMDHRGSPALGPRQDDIYQISRGRDSADRFEIVDRHGIFLLIYSTVVVGGTNKNADMSGRKKCVLRRYDATTAAGGGARMDATRRFREKESVIGPDIFY